MENATHNTFQKLTWIFSISYCFKMKLGIHGGFENVLWVAFSILLGS
jgi:hypothetical protein